MLSEGTLLAFLDTYGSDRRLDEFSREQAIQIDGVVTEADGRYLRQSRRAFEISFVELAEMLRSNQLSAFSVEVRTFQGRIRRSCVFQCPDGKLQQKLCSESSDDIDNCWEALRSRCGQ